MTLVPPEDSPPFRLAEPPKDIASLKVAILAFLATSEWGATPLRRVNTRYAGAAKRFGTTIHAVLNELATERKCAIRPFPSLNRTFVFTADEWNDHMQAQREEQIDVWARLEKVLRDVK